MKRATDDAFLQEIEARLQIPRADAEVTVRAVVSALAEVLSPLAWRHVAAVLPSSLSPQVTQSAQAIEDRATLVDHVAQRAGTRASSAWEDTIVVCDLVRDSLGEELALVRSSLPAELATLFDDRPRAQALPRTTPPSSSPEEVPAGRSLSSGKPGPQHPISEATSDVRGPAQHGSVADHDGDAARKISSATPFSPETLSSGRPR